MGVTMEHEIYSVPVRELCKQVAAKEREDLSRLPGQRLAYR